MKNVYAVEASDLSKCYRIYSHPRDRLIQAIWGRDRLGRPKSYYRSFWALRGVEFAVKTGETLGIVGRNGSGKSTLLQIICGTLQPTTGTIKTAGRIGALLELGSGFNPEFSGLENIYLNASLLGLTRSETNEKLDAILSFADIGDFVSQPVKTYSSGMAVRLAFSVQAHVDPDILVVDEALAVGDELFQKKCYSHLERLKERGTSILLVTHSSNQIMRHCDRALLLHKGEQVSLGKPAKIIITYQKILNSKDGLPPKKEGFSSHDGEHSETNEAFTDQHNYATNPMPSHSTDQPIEPFYDEGLLPQSTEVYECNGGEIEDAWIEVDGSSKVNILPYGNSFDLVFRYRSFKELSNVAMSCFIANHTGHGISGQTLPVGMGPHKGGNFEKIGENQTWEARFSFGKGLWPGVYLVSGALLEFSTGNKKFVHRVIDFRAIKVMEQGQLVELGACDLALKSPTQAGL